jgi:F420-0:gamma-glutamyl ligase-like protein
MESNKLVVGLAILPGTGIAARSIDGKTGYFISAEGRVEEKNRMFAEGATSRHYYIPFEHPMLRTVAQLAELVRTKSTEYAKAYDALDEGADPNYVPNEEMELVED